MYRTMVLIRRVEESLLELAESGKIGGAMHTAIGHEANAVGMAAALRPDDYLTCTYRGHHHSLARGMDPQARHRRGAGQGRRLRQGQGRLHALSSIPSLGLMGANGIVGAQVPHAAGMALATQDARRGSRSPSPSSATAPSSRASCTRPSTWRQKWRLPVIFYCENNRYSEMTPISRTSSVERTSTRFAHAYGMKSVQIDGNDVEVVYDAVSEAAQRARAGEGPTFIEGMTYRLAGHMAGDLETYRTAEEIEAQRAV